jgi:methionyl-tRNA formyltransferase
MSNLLKTVFFGTPEIVIPILDFINNKTQLLAVVTAEDTIQGRKKELTSTPIKKFATNKSLKVLTPEAFDEDFLNSLREIRADLFIVAAYGKILPKALLEIPKYGALNIHPSLLPKYRGPSPIQNTILNGDDKSGVSIIRMDEKMDHGPIILQSSLDLSNNDSYITLGNKLFLESLPLLEEIFGQIINESITETEQNHTLATFTKIIKKEDGYFDINNPPENLNNRIRAYYPWPTAWTKWQGKIIKFLPGNMVQMEGKNPISLKDFLNGYHDFPIQQI